MSETGTESGSESGSEELSLEEQLREAIDNYRELKDEDFGYEDGLQMFVDEAQDKLSDLVLQIEATNPPAGTELSVLLGEAIELLEEDTQGGKRRRRKTKKSKKSKKTKKSKTKARKTRRRY